jgi:hypothetical protein
VKSTALGGEERGYEGSKKVKGRKRQLLVDTEGLVLKAQVHSAKVMDFESWLSKYRRLTIRYERRDDIHEAFLHHGCSLICFNYLS